MTDTVQAEIDQQSTKGDGEGQAMQSQLMKLAYKGIHEAKKKTVYVPIRSLRHVPDFDAVLRPIDSDRVTDLSADIVCNGFRANEQVFTTPPMVDLGLARHVLGGNHRTAASRDAGVVLIPCHSVSKECIDAMMSAMGRLDESKDSDKTEQPIKRYYRCLKLLMIATQVKEPSPVARTILQMVSLIRTFVLNDPEMDKVVKRTPRATYGGVSALRHAIFGDTPLHSDNNVHFLLNKGYKARHMNKCLAGCRKLIQTKLRHTLPALKERQTLLDLLLYWEYRNFVPNFNVSHLCHVGEMSTDTALLIAEQTTEMIYTSIRENPEKIALAEAPFIKKRILQTQNKNSADNDAPGTSNVGGSNTPEAEDARDKECEDMDREVEEEEDDNSDEQESDATEEHVDNEEEDTVAGNVETDTVPPSFTNNQGSTPPRRSKRKRKQVLSSVAYSQAPASNSKRKKTGAIVKRLNKRIEGDNEMIASLEAKLEKAEALNDRQEKAIRDQQKREAEQRKKHRDYIERMQNKLVTEKKELETTATRMKEQLEEVQRRLSQRGKDEVERSSTTTQDTREALRKELEQEIQKKLQQDFEAIKKENMKLRRESETINKSAMLKVDELENLRKEIEILRQQNSSQEENTMVQELNRLRNENEELKASVSSNKVPDRNREKRNALPSEKALLALDKKQLEAFVQKASRILEEKKSD